jgi:predicted NBD/HSP70 family sugar kinase
MDTRRNSDLRRLNAIDVLDHLRTGGRMSRADLAARTTLSSQALAAILNRLMESDRVVEVAVRGGRRNPGRPALLYEYNALQTTIVSVYVGLRYTEIQFCDAVGRPVLANQEFSPGWDPQVVADESAARIAQGLDQLNVRPAACVAAIVFHGTVDSDQGVVDSPQMGWRQVPIASMLSQRTEADVTVHDASRAAAIAEHREGAARGARRSVVLNIGPEFGATLVVDGKVESGSSNLAGQLGGTLIPLEGEVRPLRELIGSVVMKARYSEESGNPVRWVTDVYRLARAGDPTAKAVVDLTVEGVAFAANWLIAIHDPERLVVTGAVGELDQRAQIRLIDRIVEQCDPRFLDTTALRISPLGRTAWTRGGVHAAIDRHRQLEVAAL